MAIKDLTVYVDNDRQCANRLQYAVRVAQHFRAHLTGVYVKRQLGLPSYADVHIPEEVLAAGERSLTALADAARKTFHNGVDGLSLQTEYHQLTGIMPDVLSANLRYADLAILAQRHAENDDLNGHYKPDSLLFQTGRPLVVVPHAGELVFPVRRAVVAWDAGAASARAIHDALPLLQDAEQVVAVTVGKRIDAALAHGDLDKHLGRHGIEIEVRNVDAPDSKADEIVLAIAADMRSNLLVMGGYGHTRLREIVLGGMTRRVLAEMTLPVLISH